MAESDKVPIRSMFVAPKNKLLLSIDLSQAESWVVAFLTNDKEAQHELKFGDIHTSTGCYIYNKTPENLSKDERYLGKKGNHMLNYGASYLRFVQVVNKEGFVTISNTEGERLVTAWHKRYNVKGWHLEVREKLNATRTLYNAYGRKRMFFGVLYGRSAEETWKEAYAHVPQSSVADHANGCIHPLLGIEGGISAIYKKIVSPSKGAIKLVNQSHDSAMLEVPKESALDTLQEVHFLMQRPIVVNSEDFIIPADGEIMERWGEGEKVKLPNPYRS